MAKAREVACSLAASFWYYLARDCPVYWSAENVDSQVLVPGIAGGAGSSGHTGYPS
ncbi:hypothetical protein [Parendozoicomonas sp. Alg238-R29]|uniref:hypothetical protein n=1 Tax=Parendozoicomonas sp. Alg238-R29 TaxID=2993446 RepID=UPI00248E7E41|nr:hypothetical protein [Parendozoicomonas sp. Alg238-R29]